MSRARQGASEPFFHQREGLEALRRLRDSERLVIYCGAGVTIDRTGLSWVDLSRALMEVKEIPEPIADSLDALRLATIASHRFRNVHGKHTNRRLVDLMSSILYRRSNFVGGQLVDVLAQYARLRQKLGLETTLITTNYDTYLEAGFAAGSYELYDREQRKSSAAGTPPIRIVYIHGRVPGKRGKKSKAFLPLVVSESDYFKTEWQTTEILASHLQDADLLVLGSSLKDLPLLRALERTRHEHTGSTNYRVAVFAREHNPVLQDAKSTAYWDDFLEGYEVDGIYADFYGQISQFVHEAAVSTLVAPEEYFEERGHLRYGNRLNRWWRQWLKKNPRDLPERQRRDHETLLAGVQRLRTILNAPPEEGLKIEVWIRWRPNDRGLRLWASSVGPWSDISLLRDVSIVTDGHFVAVQAFRAGRPVVVEVSPGAGTRWVSYVATPVWVEAAPGYVAAGVVVAASLINAPHGKVGQGNGAAMRDALVFLDGLAYEILQA